MERTHRTAGWTGVLRHRWPTALGVAVAALTAFDLELDAGFVASLSALVAVLALVYLGSAALDQRRSAWVVLLAGLPVAFFLTPVSEIAAGIVILVSSLAFVALGVARGRQRGPLGLSFQAAGMLGFGALASATLYVDTVLGAYLVAFALLGHAAWDAFHYLRDRGVSRSYAEFCGIFDVLLGAAILLALA